MEIKPQELRLGNIIQREVWGEGVVTKIGPDGFVTIQPKKLMGEISCTCIELSGIELTPEWLERFGFEYAEGFADDYTKQPITVYNNPFKVGWTVENLFNQQIKEDILVLRYVHQLQNLFYALTGEELAIDKQISNGN